MGLIQTFQELGTILEADQNRAKPYWSKQEQEAFRSWLKAEYNTRVRFVGRIDMRKVMIGVVALAGYRLWHLIADSGLF